MKAGPPLSWLQSPDEQPRPTTWTLSPLGYSQWLQPQHTGHALGKRQNSRDPLPRCRPWSLQPGQNPSSPSSPVPLVHPAPSPLACWRQAHSTYLG